MCTYTVRLCVPMYICVHLSLYVLYIVCVCIYTIYNLDYITYNYIHKTILFKIHVHFYSICKHVHLSLRVYRSVAVPVSAVRAHAHSLAPCPQGLQDTHMGKPTSRHGWLPASSTLLAAGCPLVPCTVTGTGRHLPTATVLVGSGGWQKHLSVLQDCALWPCYAILLKKFHMLSHSFLCKYHGKKT